MISIFALLVCLLVVNGKPYHGYEQPDYTLDKNQPSDNSFEVRHYPTANWTTTTMERMDMDSSDAFMKLFDYINGDNKDGVKISMTVPVTIKFQSQPCIFCNHTYEMSFYLPKKFQANPPPPSNPDIVSETKEGRLIYVRSFSGYAKKEDFMANAENLHADLLRHGVSDTSLFINKFYGSTYDSPFHMFGRKNEVWIIARNK